MVKPVNSADIAIARLRNQRDYVPMELPEDSTLSKISDAVSGFFSDLGEAISKPASTIKSLADKAKPITKLAALIGSTAIVTSVLKTPAMAIINSVLNLDKSKFIAGLSTTAFTDNAVSSIWGLVIFGLGLPIIKGLIQEQELKAPKIPKDHKTAIKEGCNIGKSWTKAAVIYTIGSSLIKNTLPWYISTPILTAYGFYGMYNTFTGLTGFTLSGLYNQIIS